jgi:RNA polymerase sigma-70 factor (ECF subfamily)
MATVELERSPDHRREASRLFEVHADWLRRYCLRQLGSPADAEDAVQTTFLHAFRALERGVVPVCEEAWLTTIAKNACRTQRRTAARRGALATDVDLDAMESPHVEDDDRELLIGLDVALASLPETQREALVLREFRGLPSREIASRLALTTAATDALLTRARRSLARALTVPRPVAGLDFGWLLSKLLAQLRLLGGGAAAKVAAVGAAAALATGVVALEQGRPATQPERPAGANRLVGAPSVRTASSTRRTTDRNVRLGTARGSVAPAPRHSSVEASSVTPRSAPPVPVDEAPSVPTERPSPPADDDGGTQKQEPPTLPPPPTLELPSVPLEPNEDLPIPPLAAPPPLPEQPADTSSVPVLPTPEPKLPLP